MLEKPRKIKENGRDRITRKGIEKYSINFPLNLSKTACRGARVSGGDLCEAEAQTEPAGETKSFCPCQVR